LCGTTYSVIDPNDVQICDGQLVESTFDQQTVTDLSIYPKQPFDISGGRTGTIAFDVNDDTNGTHSVWPELWYTDAPVPTPFVHNNFLQSVPANGFGIRLAASCPANYGAGCYVRNACPNYPANVPVVTVDSAIVVNNYVANDVPAFFPPTAPAGSLTVTPVGCVQASSGPGNMNHFELRVSQNEIDVYGTDAGTTGPLKELAIITNAGLTLTRGLVFMNDAHYNADKFGNGQANHTFTWDNFAFDGPLLPQDLALDVVDALTPVGPAYPGMFNEGWLVGPSNPTPVSLTIPGAYNVTDAIGALLTFNFAPLTLPTIQNPPAPFISYSVNNGTPQLAPWPFVACPLQNGSPACYIYTIAVPVNLSDVKAGINTVQFTSTSDVSIANVDMILRGAAGIPCTSGCPATLPMPTITITPSASTITTAQPLTVNVLITGTGSSAPVPTGTVTLSGVGFISAPVTLNGSGAATISVPAGALYAGPDLLTVAYSGDSNYLYTNENSPVTVNNIQPVSGQTAIYITPIYEGSIPTTQSDTFNIDILGTDSFTAALTPTGTVTLTGAGFDSGPVQLNGGVAQIFAPAGSMAPGTWTFMANYSGDSNFAAGSFAAANMLTITGPAITPAPPTMTTPALASTATPSTGTTADPITVTVGVVVAGSGISAPAPSGTVTLTGTGFATQTVTLNTNAGAFFAIPAGALAVGTDTLLVSYSGDSNYNATGNQLTITITGGGTLTPQTITFSSIAAQTVGTPLTLLATASSGLAVSYSSSTTAVCTVAGSTATFLTAGSCTIQAAQAGNGTFAAATPVTQSFTVNAAALTPQTITFGTIAAQTVGTPLTLSATASSGLAVSYSSSTTSVCTVAGAVTTFLTAGTCTIQATQAGNGTYAAATPVTQSFTVNAAAQTSQTITFSSIAAQTVGTPLTLSATASSGLAVSYSSSTTAVCTVAGATATFLTAGTCTIQATQAGNRTFAAATPVLQSFTVNTAAKTSQTITFGPIAVQTVGTPLTLPATASSGLAVSYSSSTTAVCTVAGATATFLTAGTCTIQATQAGNGTYAAATAVTQSFTVNAAVLTFQTITFGPIAAQTVGTPLTLSATATSGLAISYSSSTTSVCTVAGATATFLTSGTCTIQVTQVGNGTFAAATPVTQSFTVNAAAQTSQTITFAQPISQITYTSGLTILLSATGGASGNPVVFALDASSTGTGIISSSTLTVTGAGTLVIDANQAGNSSYSAAAQVQRTVVVNAAAPPTPDFAISTSPASLSSLPGVSVSLAVSVADVGGPFNSAVLLSVSGLPAGATATFAPTSVTPGSSTVSSQLTIQTATSTTTAAVSKSGWPLGVPALSFLGLMFISSKRRRGWFSLAILLFFSMGTVLALSGCGGSSSGLSNITPPPATYTLIVTGISGTDTHSSTAQLSVQ